jgi:hypothetical protein
MKRTFLILAAFLCATGAATAQTSVPPSFKLVAGTNKDKGHVSITDTVMVPVFIQKVVVAIENGQKVERVETVTEYRYETREYVFDAGKSRIITPDGKQLPIEEVWKRLKKGTVVVVSGDGNTPAQEYLRALNAETLVIIQTPAQVVVPMPIAPPPLEKKKVD